MEDPSKKNVKKKKTRGKEIMQGKDIKTSKDFNILIEIREDIETRKCEQDVL